jgi:aminopeptidase N
MTKILSLTFNLIKMKNFYISFFLLAMTSLVAQRASHACSEAKIAFYQGMFEQQQQQQKTASTSAQISHEMGYDMKFVHLMLNLERTTKYVSGGVRIVSTVTVASLDTFQCVLHKNHTVDSLRINGVLCSVVRKDSIAKAKLPTSLVSGQTIDAYMYYKGNAPTGGSAIGSGYSTGTSTSWGNSASWSLSEAIAAYHWWPCKQINTDKIDSSWVFVTTDSLNKVGSNGLLKNVVVVGNKKRYEWKSRTPIAYYLISVAIAKYKEYNLYAKPQYLAGDSIWIQNYIYDNAWSSSTFQSGQKVTLDKIKQQMELQCNLYGMYPFYKEKYGHCMAPFSGGMEHQTMTSLGFFDYYVNTHELGHQWWGDNVTCKGWGHIWINEGFASYTEHLTAIYLDPTNFLPNLNSAHTNVMSQPGGAIYLSNADTMNATKVFSSRIEYDKGGSVIRTLQFVVNNDSVWFNGLRGFQQTFKNSTASIDDFKNYMQTFTGMNFTQFFNQWIYGEGYPTFNVTWNFVGNQAIIKSTQSTSTPTSVALFQTPMEYKLQRSGVADTVIRVMHSNTTELYNIPCLGTVIGIVVDPNQWVLNKVIGPTKDVTLGISELENKNFELRISPNPGSGIYKVNFEDHVKGTYEVYDMSGKLVADSSFDTVVSIDISNKAEGIYTIVFKNESGFPVNSVKLVKN